MIYHFFNGHVIQTSLANIDSWVFAQDELGISEQKFVISNLPSCVMANLTSRLSEETKEEYANIIKQNNSNQYVFWQTKTDLLRILLGIKSSDVIIFHSVIANFRLQMLAYIILYIKGLLHNALLICWSGRDFYPLSNKSLKGKIIFYSLKYFFKRMKAIGLISREDKRAFDELYDLHGKMLPLFTKKQIIPIRYPKFSKEDVVIMVSHSGWPHNQHLKSFEYLKRFKDRNIRIICPLCYGDPNYINNVIETGRSCFGERFTYFTDLMPVADYLDMINNQVDIYVTSADIQTGLFASNNALYSGARLFVGENNYRSYKENGVIVNHVNELNDISFDAFVEPISDSQYSQNIAAMMKFYDRSKIIAKYKTLIH